MSTCSTSTFCHHAIARSLIARRTEVSETRKSSRTRLCSAHPRPRMPVTMADLASRPTLRSLVDSFARHLGISQAGLAESLEVRHAQASVDEQLLRGPYLGGDAFDVSR